MENKSEYTTVGFGSLSANEFKKTDSQPGYTGKVTVNGVKYRLAGFLKENENGKYFSLSVTQKTEGDNRQEEQSYQAPARDPDDDQIPF